MLSIVPLVFATRRSKLYFCIILAQFRCLRLLEVLGRFSIPTDLPRLVALVVVFIGLEIFASFNLSSF